MPRQRLESQNSLHARLSQREALRPKSRSSLLRYAARWGPHHALLAGEPATAQDWLTDLTHLDLMLDREGAEYDTITWWNALDGVA